MQECPWIPTCCAVFLDFPSGSVVKGPVCNARDTGDVGSITKVGRSPGEGITKPPPVFLPEKSYGQRSMAGYSPKGHRVVHEWVIEHVHTYINIINIK